MAAHPHTARAKALVAEAMYIVGEGKDQEVTALFIGALMLLSATTTDPRAYLRAVAAKLEEAVVAMPPEVAVGRMGRGVG